MAQKDRLGKGLSALLGDAALTEDSDFLHLPIVKIEPRREQPRVEFAAEPLEELADSIREHGVLQPLTVREMGGGVYQIIAGERRWRASRLAGLEEVPVRVVIADDRTATELALVENLQRENLNPIEEAAGYRALMEGFGLTQEDVARRMGKSRPAVANTLRLLSLPEPILEPLRRGELSSGAGRALLGLHDSETMETMAREVISRGLNVREVEKLVKKRNSKPKSDAKPAEIGSAIDVDYIAEVQQELSHKLGRKLRIVPGKHKGRIEIEYYDEEDFLELLDWLGRNAGVTK
ncbi:MAG: ParB/RepB/Spo0J family partition protein [Oscillospiraceae bacterium]|nr:ParB/RepB/Spo0J family partition protein [Oscillospiraceae bacterium]